MEPKPSIQKRQTIKKATMVKNMDNGKSIIYVGNKSTVKTPHLQLSNRFGALQDQTD